MTLTEKLLDLHIGHTFAMRAEAAEEIKRLSSENSTLKASLEELRNERRKRLFVGPFTIQYDRR